MALIALLVLLEPTKPCQGLQSATYVNLERRVIIPQQRIFRHAKFVFLENIHSRATLSVHLVRLERTKSMLNKVHAKNVTRVNF
tara:strand:+ start:344 stop:595 length:252 start_codon:yes stop_codon:yes gene_type:complete